MVRHPGSSSRSSRQTPPRRHISKRSPPPRRQRSPPIRRLADIEPFPRRTDNSRRVSRRSPMSSNRRSNHLDSRKYLPPVNNPPRYVDPPLRRTDSRRGRMEPFRKNVRPLPLRALPSMPPHRSLPRRERSRSRSPITSNSTPRERRKSGTPTTNGDGKQTTATIHAREKKIQDQLAIVFKVCYRKDISKQVEQLDLLLQKISDMKTEFEDTNKSTPTNLEELEEIDCSGDDSSDKNGKHDDDSDLSSEDGDKDHVDHVESLELVEEDILLESSFEISTNNRNAGVSSAEEDNNNNSSDEDDGGNMIHQRTPKHEPQDDINVKVELKEDLEMDNNDSNDTTEDTPHSPIDKELDYGE